MSLSPGEAVCAGSSGHKLRTAIILALGTFADCVDDWPDTRSESCAPVSLAVGAFAVKASRYLCVKVPRSKIAQ